MPQTQQKRVWYRYATTNSNRTNHLPTSSSLLSRNPTWIQASVTANIQPGDTANLQPDLPHNAARGGDNNESTWVRKWFPNWTKPKWVTHGTKSEWKLHVQSDSTQPNTNPGGNTHTIPANTSTTSCTTSIECVPTVTVRLWHNTTNSKHSWDNQGWDKH